MRPPHRGQATVELALCLPIVALLLGAVIEVGMLAGDQARLWHAAREAAREAVVNPDATDVRTAAERSGLKGLVISITPDPAHRVQGEPLTVRLAYRPAGTIPLVGALFERVELHAVATMRIERP
jgi:TadE-like protein